MGKDARTRRRVQQCRHRADSDWLGGDGELWDRTIGRGGRSSGAGDVEEVAASRQEEEAAAMMQLTFWPQLKQARETGDRRTKT